MLFIVQNVFFWTQVVDIVEQIVFKLFFSGRKPPTTDDNRGAQVLCTSI